MSKIAIVPGDGVGADVTAEAMKVLEAVMYRSGLDLKLVHFDYGAERYLNTGVSLPDEQIEEFRRDYGAIFLGPLGDPRLPDMAYARDILLRLRLKLDLYLNCRPVKLLNAKYCPLKDKAPEDINFVVFRENLEGPSPDISGIFKRGTPDEETIQQSIFTRKGCQRIIRTSFEYARRRGLKRVAVCSRGNSFSASSDIWATVFDEIGRDYPEVEKNNFTLAELIGQLLRNSSQFELIVTCSSYGDVIADLGSELQGGMGLAAESNLHPGKLSLYMPAHGPLTRYAGQNIANPLAAISALAMMLEDLGFEQEASWVCRAVKYALDTDNTTRDLGGRLGTSQVGDFITDQIKKGAH